MNNRSKYIAALLVLLTLFCSCSFLQQPPTPTATQPTELATIVEPTPPPTEPQTLPPAPTLDVQSAFVYDLKNRQYLYKNAMQNTIAPASITKLLTACIAMEYFNADDAITVGTELNMVQPNSSLCFITYGHCLTILDLLYGLLLQSGNDAAYTLAVNVARKESGNPNLSDSEAVQHFTQIMNSFAAEIGMKNSHFTSPDGYDTSEQYVTPEDILLLAMTAKKYPIINMIVSTFTKNMTFLSGETITWTNTNQFLDINSVYYNPYVSGMKTGSTVNAGTCLLTSYNDGDHDLILFVAGCKSDEARYEQTSMLINWAIQ